MTCEPRYAEWAFARTRPRTALADLLGQLHAAVRPERKVRIPGDLPRVTVRVREVARVPAPFRPLRGLEQGCPRRHCLGQHALHRLRTGDIVRERDAAKAGAYIRNARIG